MIPASMASLFKCGTRCFVLVLMLNVAGGCVTAGNVTPSNEPAISCAEKHCSVILPSDAQEEIASRFPGFTPYEQTCFPEYYSHDYPFSSRQAMFAVVADFNGDGRADVALLGTQGKTELLIAVVSSGQKYEGLLIDSWGNQECGSVDLYLTYAAPGWYEEFREEPGVRRFKLSNAGFELSYDEKAARMFAYQNGTFQYHTTGD